MLLCYQVRGYVITDRQKRIMIDNDLTDFLLI